VTENYRIKILQLYSIIFIITIINLYIIVTLLQKCCRGTVEKVITYITQQQI